MDNLVLSFAFVYFFFSQENTAKPALITGFCTSTVQGYHAVLLTTWILISIIEDCQLSLFPTIIDTVANHRDILVELLLPHDRDGPAAVAVQLIKECEHLIG